MNVYDFDKTIYNGDSTADFYIFALKRHKKIIFNLPSLFGAFIKFYILRIGTKTRFKQTMYKFLTKCDVEKDVEDFWKINENKIKDFYFVQQKEDDVIISASPLFLLKPICDKLNIHFLIASNVDSKTGKYSGENCHGKEKVRRFYDVFGKDARVDCFYSDSLSDTPMAKIACKAYLVDGDNIKKWEIN